MSVTFKELAARALPWEKRMKLPGIGASEMGAILGLDPYRSPLDVFLEKTGKVKRDGGSDQTRWGHHVEVAIGTFLDQAFKDRGLCFVPIGTFQHPEHAWLFATPDFVASRPGDGTVPFLVEAKKVGHRVLHQGVWGEPGTDLVPHRYLLQAQLQLMCTGLEECRIYPSLGGEPPPIEGYPIHRNSELEEQVLTIARSFWFDNVLKDIPPDPGQLEELLEYAKKLHPSDDGSTLTPEEVGEDLLVDLIRAKRSAAKAEEVYKSKKGEVAVKMGAAKLLEGGGRIRGKLHFGSQDGKKSLDVEALCKGLGIEKDRLSEFEKRGEPFRVFRDQYLKLAEEI